MKIFNKKNIKNEGFSIVELLFYIALFVLLSVVIINAIVTMTRAFRETEIEGQYMQGADVMERITRGIRGSYDINTITSSSLKLNDDQSAPASTIQFSLSGTNIQYYEDDVLIGNLNAPNISVSSLVFTQITTAKGKAVKMSMTITSTNDPLARTQDFYNTVVLRGGY